MESSTYTPRSGFLSPQPWVQESYNILSDFLSASKHIPNTILRFSSNFGDSSYILSAKMSMSSSVHRNKDHVLSDLKMHRKIFHQLTRQILCRKYLGTIRMHCDYVITEVYFVLSINLYHISRASGGYADTKNYCIRF